MISNQGSVERKHQHITAVTNTFKLFLFQTKTQTSFLTLFALLVNHCVDGIRVFIVLVPLICECLFINLKRTCFFLQHHVVVETARAIAKQLRHFLNMSCVKFYTGHSQLHAFYVPGEELRDTLTR